MIIASGTIIQQNSRITDGARRTRAAVRVSCVAIASMPFAFQTELEEITNDRTLGAFPIARLLRRIIVRTNRRRSATVSIIDSF